MSKFSISLIAFLCLLMAGARLTSCQSNDFEGKQVLEQVHCQQAGGEMINRPTGRAYTTEYVSSLPYRQHRKDYRQKQLYGFPSLPYRQLRNFGIWADIAELASLPYRQLRNCELG